MSIICELNKAFTIDASCNASDEQEIKQLIKYAKILNDPDEETTALLQEVLERFYLDKRVSYMEKYTVVEMILSRLSKDTAWNMRKEKAARLKDALIEDAGGWKQIVSELIYVAGEEPSILVEFWEMVADEMGELPDTECIEWLTRLQLLLPAELGRRLYLIKSRFLGGK